MNIHFSKYHIWKREELTNTSTRNIFGFAGIFQRLGLHKRRFFRIRDESGTFWYRIRFAVYTQVDKSAIKTFRFGRVSGDLNPEFKVGTLYPNTFESGKFCSVNVSLTNPNIFLLLSRTFSERFLPYLKFSHS